MVVFSGYFISIDIPPADSKDFLYLPCNCVVCMRASRGVGIWSLILLFNGGVGKCLSAGMLAVPYCVGCAVDEADHVMFPVCL